MRIKRRDFLKLLSAGMVFPWKEFFKSSRELEFLIYTSSPEKVLKKLSKKIETISGKKVSLFAINREAQIVKNNIQGYSPRLGSINAVFELREVFKTQPGITAIREGKVFDPRKGVFSEISLLVYSEKRATTLLKVKFGAEGSQLIGDKGERAEIFVNGNKIEEFSLKGKKEITINTNHGKMVFAVKDEKISVKKTLCRHEICKLRGEIGYKGEKIVCAPQRVLVKVKGEGIIDAITG